MNENTTDADDGADDGYNVGGGPARLYTRHYLITTVMCNETNMPVRMVNIWGC